MLKEKNKELMGRLGSKMSANSSSNGICHAGILRWSMRTKAKEIFEKKNHLPNDQFLIKNLLKNYVFGSSERLPPLSAVPPTNKKTHPPISKPHPAKKSFFPPCLSHVQVLCFFATATSTLHCQMFPHQPPSMFLVHLLNFMTPKPKKKHFPNDRFLIKILLKNDDFGSSERLPPLSAVPPTNKKTHPPISKPHPAKKSFFPPCFSHVQVLCFFATATSTLHCLMFPHPPPRDVFGPSVKFQDAKTEKKIIPQMIDF